jgi:hypothetical protein
MVPGEAIFGRAQVSDKKKAAAGRTGSRLNA